MAPIPAGSARPARTIAVVLAGGTGQRVGSPLPKQLIEVAGRPILAHAIAAFDAHSAIDAVLVVMAAGHTERAAAIAAPFGKVSAVIEGGDSRTASTLAALAALRGEPDDALVLFHDAARPFVTAAVIDRCVTALAEYDAVAVGVPAADTIVAVRDGLVHEMPSRAGLRRFQTPQGFRLGVIRAAYEKARAAPEASGAPAATDDCGVVHRHLPEVPIKVVEGDERNLKVTHPLDVAIAERLARESSEPRREE